jgi:hypothetical protein
MIDVLDLLKRGNAPDFLPGWLSPDIKGYLFRLDS